MNEDDEAAALAHQQELESQWFEEDIGYVEWLLKLEQELDRTCPRE